MTMRIAIVSDIHGNRTAFEAVLADLQDTAPDRIFHGGDLAGPGTAPVEIVDRVRDLGWRGVVGNTDELLFRPESLGQFAAQSPPSLAPVFSAIEEIAAVTRASLGEERLAWLAKLPRVQQHDSVALVHASPRDLWRAPAAEATDSDLESAYAPLEHGVIVYGHIHTPYIRRVGERSSPIAAASGCPMTEIDALPIFWWTTEGHRSGESNTISIENCRRFPAAACLTQTGLHGRSGVLGLKCHDLDHRASPSWLFKMI